MSSQRSIHTFSVLAYQESPYLEECIKSVLAQDYSSEVVIATSTPNQFIEKLAKKYNLEIKVNDGKTGIGADFDFALNAGETELVTIAHQDDIYDPGYSKAMVEAYCKHPDSLIIFPNYYELRNGERRRRYKPHISTGPDAFRDIQSRSGIKTGDGRKLHPDCRWRGD